MGEPAIRNDLGRFTPGASGNPTGRPKRLKEIEDQLIELHGPKASDVMQRLYEIIMDPEQVRAASAAAKVFLDRLLGQPKSRKPEQEDEEVDATNATELMRALLSRPEMQRVALEVLQGGKK